MNSIARFILLFGCFCWIASTRPAVAETESTTTHEDAEDGTSTTYTDTYDDGTITTVTEEEKKDGTRITTTKTTSTGEDDYGEKRTITTEDTLTKKPGGQYGKKHSTHEEYTGQDGTTTEIDQSWEEDDDEDGTTTTSKIKDYKRTDADGSTLLDVYDIILAGVEYGE